jgi:hypothetical protein
MFYLSNRHLKIQNLLEKIILLLKTISSEKEKYISFGRLIFARAFCASLGWDHDIATCAALGWSSYLSREV